MASLLAAARPHLAGALVDAAGFAGVSLAARLLPALSGAILECRLAEDDATADLSIRLLTTDGGRERFAGVDADPGFPCEWLAVAEWRRVRDFCRAWADVRSPLHAQVETAWLEFDSPTLGEAVPRPCVFFSTPALPAPRLDALIGQAVATLLGEPLPRGTRVNLRRCLDALPADAALTFIGLMLARATGTVRVCAGMRAGEVAEFLAAIGWSHPTAQVEWALGRVARDPAASLVVTLDVGETILPTLGIELKADAAASWPVLLDRLVSLGLCTAAKAAAALQWRGYDVALRGMKPGVDTTPRPPSSGPAAATAMQVRTINHVKVVTHPHRPPIAKVYLYAGFIWPAPCAGTAHSASGKRVRLQAAAG
jgi:hypothetical protein